MGNTEINLTQTKITFYDSVEEIAKTVTVQGKQTVKESKEYIPTDSKFITKEIVTDTFMVDTQDLLALRINQN